MYRNTVGFELRTLGTEHAPDVDEIQEHDDTLHNTDYKDAGRKVLGKRCLIVLQAGKDNGDDCEYDDEGSIAFGAAHTHGAEDTRGDGCPGEQTPEDGSSRGNQDKQAIFIHWHISFLPYYTIV